MATLGAMGIAGHFGLSFAGTTTGTGAAATTVGGGFGAMSMGVGLLIVGGLIDAKLLSGLGGKGRAQWEPPRLVDMAAVSTGQGEPSPWAIGTRIRVPVHVLWQSEKVREETPSTGLKAGTAVPMKRVLVSCALAVNERQTHRIIQLIGNGKLLLFATRNIVTIRGHEMTVTESGGRLVLSMNDVLSPDFTQKFDDGSPVVSNGDVVLLSGFVPVSGPNINTGYWKVYAVTEHTSTPSTMTLEPYQGQSLVGLNSNAGSAAAPAEIARVDDALVEHRWFVQTTADSSGIFVDRLILSLIGGGEEIQPQPSDLFAAGDRVRLSGFSASSVNSAMWIVAGAGDDVIYLRPDNPFVVTMASVAGMTCGTSSNASRIEFWDITTSAAGLFPASFVAADHYHPGNETQTEDSILISAEGAGNIGGYRGVAYQALEDMECTTWNGIPQQLEALIQPDQAMTWGEAIVLLCERSGVPPQFVDVSGVSTRPFEGMYLRGPVPGATALQSLLIAGQIATQDRDGVLCFFDIDNGDVLQIPNDAFVRMEDGSKWQFEDMAPEDLPTSVGVRHQDPDNLYTDGYQTRGDRNPSAGTNENRQEINLQNVALSRKQAHELCGTLMRRAYVNSRQVRYTLPPSYMDVLENDLHTFTDDEGNDLTVRVIRRDIGANFLVQVTAVCEEVEINVSGSPVQSVAGRAPNPFVQLADVNGAVLDIPPLRNAEMLAPGLIIAAAPLGGGAWAGCTVYMSSNAGSDWTQVAALSQPSAVGRLTSSLAAVTVSGEQHGTTSLTWDATSSFTVELDSDGVIPPVTFPEFEVVRGFNWFAITTPAGVTEIIGVRDVVQTGTRAYTFSYLLRGLRGTSLASKAAGCRIVGVSKLSELSGAFLDMEGQNPTLEFRFVAPGRDVESTPSVALTAQWRNYLPMPVRDISKRLDSSFNARFYFDHWSRETMALGQLGPYALDEQTERYRVTIYDQNGTVALRVFNLLPDIGSNTIRDKWVDYSATLQTADGYTPAATETFWIDVQQLADDGRLGPSVLREL